MTDQVNIPLLRKAVEWAEAEAMKPPELCEWKQDSFFLPGYAVQGAGRSPECGSCYCIAGYIAEVEGFRLTLDNAVAAPTIAAEALGLDIHRAWDLFWSDNTIADVRRIAEEIAGERL